MEQGLAMVRTSLVGFHPRLCSPRACSLPSGGVETVPDVDLGALDPDKLLTYYEQAGDILVNDQPGPILLHPIGSYVVSPAITGSTPTSGEGVWPGQFSSIMTIDKSS
jgi:hypothetical protein